MDSTRCWAELPVLFQKLTDPRNPRGVRFPESAKWPFSSAGDEAHWAQLREPLGFTRAV